MKKEILIMIFLIACNLLHAQYNMQNLTVYDCEGTLKDSESNALNPSWYSHNEHFNFTICPTNALQITINFTLFSTELVNDYVMIYDGPNNTFPVLGGPYSGTNLPPQIISSGCVTIEFISDQNVAEEGFELYWETDIAVPLPPTITLPSTPTCSTTTLNVELDQLIHCDSIATSQIYVGGQINQIVNAIPLNCINDSTNTIQLDLIPGLNESGIYNIYFESFFTDECNNIWNLSTDTQFIIDDCPLEVNLYANNTTICAGDCADIYVDVTGGDSTSYNYIWSPPWMNSPGIQTVCPSSTTQYIVTVDDNGSSIPTSDTITINVINPPVVQNPITICQTDVPINLTASPLGGNWSGPGIINSNTGLFSANQLPAGIYNVNYEFNNCDDNLDITVLEVNAGPDISACINAPTFNLNSSVTTPGGVWSGCTCIQSNGDITVGGNVGIVEAIYTLPNGCSDTLLVSIVNNITLQNSTTLCQQSGNYPLTFTPANGIWSILTQNPQSASNCINPIDIFPHHEGWENGFNGWYPDPSNDFDWTINHGGTPSVGTGPQSAIEGLNYIYTEASNPNHPDKIASIISPCLNLSAYNNPVLHFSYHKYGAGQGNFAIDISTDNGATWNWNHWTVSGDLGNQWNQVSIDLSSYNTAEVLIRLRVKTGDWQSDVAVDNLSILGGPITIDGYLLTNVALPGTHNLIYSIEGCNDFLDISIDEINAGPNQVACPTQLPFNLAGSPNNGIWNGNNITNTNTGTFDPSLGSGLNIVTYAMNGCIDTAEIWVVETDILIDSLFVCVNSGNQNLDAIRIPWNGVWNGIGITNTNFPGIFNPLVAGPGIHNISYSANTCTDDLTIQVFERSVLSDTLICSTSPDILLNVDPAGGYWTGNGIVNATTGLFSPSQLGAGSYQIAYLSPNNCADTFSIHIYENPIVSMAGLSNYYCNKDTTIQINVSPSGGMLTGNGIVNNTFNPILAGTGYHTISYSYGSGNCIVEIDTIIFVDDELTTTTYQTQDSICKGDLVSIGVSANGGVGNYFFSWNNGLSNSFEHLISPSSSTNYIVTSSDGCSEDIQDTISIYVLPDFSVNFTTSEKRCYGEKGYAMLEVIPSGNYSYKWNTNPISYNDTIYEDVNKKYMVEITDQTTQCIISDTITIPGYNRLDANFIKHTSNCLSLNNNSLQLLSNSIFAEAELLELSSWSFGDGTIIPFEPGVNPYHTYSDTGRFQITLTLINEGGCIDSLIDSVCIISQNELYAPNSFTPDGDNCNDIFYLYGLGYFKEFNIKIYQRWGEGHIYESEEVMSTNTYSDLNTCNDNNPYKEYQKMGSWDGKINNGTEAQVGTYIYLATYLLPNEDKYKYLIGHVTLIR